MYIPSLSGDLAVYGDSIDTEVSATLDNFDNADEAADAQVVYVMLPDPLPTPGKFSVVQWKIGRSAGTTLSGGNQVAFGTILEGPADIDPDAPHTGTVYSYSITAAMANVTALVMPFIGKPIASTTLAAWNGAAAAPANRKNACLYAPLPFQYAAGGNMSARGKVLIGDNFGERLTNLTGPVIIGVTIRNEYHNRASAVADFTCHIGAMRWSTPVDLAQI